MQAANQKRLVSNSFIDCDMLSDDAISEDYDADPYIQSFNDNERIVSLEAPSIPIAGNPLGLNVEGQEEEKVPQGTSKPGDDFGLNLDEQDQQLPTDSALQPRQSFNADEGLEVNSDDEREKQERVLAEELERQTLILQGLQKSIIIEINALNSKGKALQERSRASLADFIDQQHIRDETLKLKLEIERYKEDAKKNIGFLGLNYNAYNDYFNFELNTTTWPLYVNKQILMRYERLFIEKQMQDVANEKRGLESQLKSLEDEIKKYKDEQERIKNGGSINQYPKHHQSHYSSRGGGSYGHSSGRGRSSGYGAPPVMSHIQPSAMPQYPFPHGMMPGFPGGYYMPPGGNF